MDRSKLMRVAGAAREPTTRPPPAPRCLSALRSSAGALHPDHRGEQSLNFITNGNFGAITHAGRGIFALATYYRYAGLNPENEAPESVRAHSPAMVQSRAPDRCYVAALPFMISAAQRGIAVPHFSQSGPQAHSGVRQAGHRSCRRPCHQSLQAAGTRLIGRTGTIVKQ